MRIGIIRYWADRPVAEHEVIARMDAALQARGHVLVQLNPDGSALGDPAVQPPVDLVLNLHYLSPKSRDVPSVGLLWNPIEFYHNFGFVPHFANQVSHDYLATAGARLVEQAFAPLRPDLFGEALPVVNHTVPERYLPAQTRSDRRLFYVGVNWERIIGIGGRHSDLLSRLDAMGASEIYGPRQIEGIAPWEGYRTYKGELPFDGWSVVEAISRAGTVLVASSPAHYRDGIMSCRPFESAAAGVPLISERHPFMVEHFEGAALFFDERAPVAEQTEQILAHMRTLNDDSDLAMELATRAQDVVRKRFNLDEQLDQLATWVTAREAARPVLPTVQATAVVVPTGDAAAVSSWSGRHRAVLSRFAQVRLVPPSGGPDWAAVAALLGDAVVASPSTRSDTGWSERAAQAAADLEGPVVFLLGVEELWAGYPDVVAAAVGESGIGLAPAVAVSVDPALPVNDRQPRLLATTVSGWWGLPVASVVATGERLRELRDLLGPGTHLGVLGEQALDQDAVGREAFVPVLRVTDGDDGLAYDVGALLGQERHRDALYARALPSSLTAALPRGLFVRETAVPPVGMLTRLAGAVRRSRLPKPVSQGLILASKSVLRRKPPR